jgi:type II secretory pathway predicted ATPase ExeA/cell division septation protein DedD
MNKVTQHNYSDETVLPHSLSTGVEQVFGDRIYTHYFNLKGAPFSITPDPEFLFLSETHQNVIEKIQYGIQTRMGFMLLTGEVGTGKTTLCRVLLDHFQDTIRTVYVINPSLGGQELLAGILDDLGIFYPPASSKKELIDRLNQCLLDDETVSPVVIIVDDAQTMPLSTLEDLRLLSNLETDKSKLLQMLLVGQSELLMNLDQPQMRQLKQRVALSCHLDFLTSDEVGSYIERRLFIAGNQGQLRFSPIAVKHIHKQSGGIPRMINKICDLALTAAYAANSNVIEKSHLKAAATELIELQGDNGGSDFIGRLFKSRVGMALLAVATLMGAMVLGYTANSYFGNMSRTGPTLEASTAIHSKADALQAVKTYIPEPSQAVKPTASLSSQEIRAYILQLGSFNTLPTTLRAVDIYSRKGIDAHWNAVQLGGKGLWYRVFVGRFTSIESARQYQNHMGVADAQILFAPWAVVLEQSASVAQLASVRDRLQAQGVDSYIAQAQNNISHLCAGAFISQNRAEEVARRIQQQTGMATRVANFYSTLVSGHLGNHDEEKDEAS